MQKSIRNLIWIAALSCTSLGFAAEAKKAPPFVSIEEAIEAGSMALVLPSGPGSALVVTPCTGCKPILARATAATTYFLHKRQVSLAEFKAALSGKTVAVTVFRSTKDGALTRVIANIDAPQPARNR